MRIKKITLKIVTLHYIIITLKIAPCIMLIIML